MTAIAPRELGNPIPATTPRSDLAVAGLAALGIVFGDIGTSPLYTLKTAFPAKSKPLLLLRNAFMR